ncbi:hypothetical protein EIP86_005811 [Pleurotus ostreatoroseus]|nr:hypothetical protein EIP86_005811 [Pleurotus ostreatoroseus]
MKDLARAKAIDREVYDIMATVTVMYGLFPAAWFWYLIETYAFPGGLMIDTDSHTPNDGDLGMVASGTMITDVEKYVNMDETWVEPEPEPYKPKGWTDLYVSWLWGGSSREAQQRFAHPLVKLIDFSPNENYLITWSHDPIVVPEGIPQGPQFFSPEDEGNNIAVWDIKTGNLLRTFPSVMSEGEDGVKRQMQWLALKWSTDDQFVGRVTPGQQISVYELPSMRLHDKKSIKIEGVVDFEWCPIGDKDKEEAEKAAPAGKKVKENMLAYWIEVANQPARVTVINFPNGSILRQKNLFNVSDPKGERFAIISTSDPNLGNPAPGITIKTDVSFYQLVRGKGDLKLLCTLPNRTSNTIRWSPRGRHVVLATVGSSTKSELEFWDLDSNQDEMRREGPSQSKDEWDAGIQHLGTADHYAVTDAEWDPSGHYLATSASAWRHTPLFATITHIAVSLGRQWFATTDDHRRMYIFNLDAVAYHCVLPSFPYPVHALAFDTYTSALILGLSDNTLQVYDVEARTFLAWSHVLANALPPQTHLKASPGLRLYFPPTPAVLVAPPPLLPLQTGPAPSSGGKTRYTPLRLQVVLSSSRSLVPYPGPMRPGD